MVSKLISDVDTPGDVIKCGRGGCERDDDSEHRWRHLSDAQDMLPALLIRQAPRRRPRLKITIMT